MLFTSEKFLLYSSHYIGGNSLKIYLIYGSWKILALIILISINVNFLNEKLSLWMSLMWWLKQISEEQSIEKNIRWTEVSYLKNFIANIKLDFKGIHDKLFPWNSQHSIKDPKINFGNKKFIDSKASNPVRST